MIPSFDDIMEMARHHPSMQAGIVLFMRGEVTKDECLRLCVWELANEATEIKNVLYRISHQAIPPSVVLTVSEKTLEATRKWIEEKP